MSNDYKYEIQMIAEALAEERGAGLSLHEMTEEQQYFLWMEAEIDWAEMRAGEYSWIPMKPLG